MGILRNTLNIIQGKKEGWIKRKWVFDTYSEILAPPLSYSYKGQIYLIFGTKAGTLYALNSQSKVKWEYNIKDNFSDTEKLFMDKEALTSITSTPSIYTSNNGEIPLILFGSEDCFLYAININGEFIWKFKTGGIIRTTPLICDVDGNNEKDIIFGSNDHFLYVLNKEGKMKLKFEARSEIESPPSVIEKKQGSCILFGSNDGYLYCVDIKGEKVWEFKTEGKITAQPVVVNMKKENDQIIIFGSSDGNLYVVDEEGVLKWRFETEGGISSKVSVADINKDQKMEIIFGCSDDKVYCVSYNGNKIWDFEADFWIVSTPLINDIDEDGKMEVIFGSLDSTLYILDAEGEFTLNYIPGISSITQQRGHYQDVISNDVGEYNAKKIWQIKTDGMVTSTSIIEDKNNKSIIVGTKNGKIEKYCYVK